MAGVKAILDAGLFQLPRIAKPSGTGQNHAPGAAPEAVSTSPDSKAIRNNLKAALLPRCCWFQLPRIAKPSGTLAALPLTVSRSQVSTSPDSKAIRNPGRGGGISPVGHLVSTSPDSKAIRNPGPHQARCRKGLEGHLRAAQL